MFVKFVIKSTSSMLNWTNIFSCMQVKIIKTANLNPSLSEKITQDESIQECIVHENSATNKFYKIVILVNL